MASALAFGWRTIAARLVGATMSSPAAAAEAQHSGEGGCAPKSKSTTSPSTTPPAVIPPCATNTSPYTSDACECLSNPSGMSAGGGSSDHVLLAAAWHAVGSALHSAKDRVRTNVVAANVAHEYAFVVDAANHVQMSVAK